MPALRGGDMSRWLAHVLKAFAKYAPRPDSTIAQIDGGLLWFTARL
jgi:hypothetical protein